MAEQRMVPVELLESLLDDVGEPIYNADNYAKLRAIIDGPGVEPVAKFVKDDYGDYPIISWRFNSIARIGDVLYIDTTSSQTQEATTENDRQWLTLDQIRAEYDSGVYSPELLLQHMLHLSDKHPPVKDD